MKSETDPALLTAIQSEAMMWSVGHTRVWGLVNSRWRHLPVSSYRQASRLCLVYSCAIHRVIIHFVVSIIKSFIGYLNEYNDITMFYINSN